MDIKSTNQSLSSFTKRISDVYTHNTLSYVLPTSGVQGDIYMCLLMGKEAKGGLDWDGGPLYAVICLVQDINWDIVLSPAPVAILILFIFPLFHFFNTVINV